MKTTDLMIGDWVNYRPGWIDEETKEVVYESKTGFPIRLTCLYDGLSQYDSVFPDGSINTIEVADYELFAIPLTPEILEKNGFRETDAVVVGTRKMRWESEDGRTEITIWMDCTMSMEIRKNIYYEDEECYTLPFAWAVHKLQHALRLCEIEKEIVL